MRLKRVDDLPAQIYEHAQQNPIVLRHIIGLYARLNEQEIAHPHPFLMFIYPNNACFLNNQGLANALSITMKKPLLKAPGLPI